MEEQLSRFGDTCWEIYIFSLDTQFHKSHGFCNIVISVVRTKQTYAGRPQCLPYEFPFIRILRH